MNLVVTIITLAIIAGQIIRIRIGSGGITLLDLVIIAFCTWGLFRSKFRLKKPPKSIVAAFIFVLVATVSLIFTPLHLQPLEYLTSFSYIIRFTLYILFAWLIFSKSFGDFQKEIHNTLIYSGLGLAILGLLQFIFLPDLGFLTKEGWDPHYFRTVSTFLDPNFAGAFFVLTLILLFKNAQTSYPQTSYFRGRNTMTPRVLYILFIITFLALLTTFSRSSYLMFLISGLSLSFFKKSKSLVLIVITLFLVLLLGFKIYTQLISKPRNIDRGQSASFRLNTWQQGLILFQKFPILGVGFNAYKFALKEFELGNQQFLQNHGSTGNDSSLLFVASTTGIVGFVSYLFFLISLIWETKNYTLISIILGLMIHSIFSNSLFFPPILLWLLLTSAVPKK